MSHTYERTPPEGFMTDISKRLNPIRFNEKVPSLEVIDQLRVPHRFEYIAVNNVREAFLVIQNMHVRGAPLIATVAMLGIYIESFTPHKEDVHKFIEIVSAYLVNSRPTAINLKNALDSLSSNKEITDYPSLREYLLKFYRSEVEENRKLIWHGYNELLNQFGGRKDLVIMTICNTGSMATTTWGTALGVIATAYHNGIVKEVIALETRPYLQGSRLTASELLHQKIPFRLITDGMAAAAIKQLNVDLIIVGCDHVARNGDTANKVGTYGLAILAQFHRIPLYVALPLSTFNYNRRSGETISIEERPADELRVCNGRMICPVGTPVWNPAFDVTPHELIHKYITEKGNFTPEGLEDVAFQIELSHETATQ